jgi:predicted ArsR family transcriptional regulator
MKEYIRGYYCRDEMDLQILNKDRNQTILEPLRDVQPSGLTAHELQKKTGLPMNTIYAQLKELYREYFIMEVDNNRQPKPRGRPSAKKTQVTIARQRQQVIIENSSGIYDTHEGEQEGKI